MVFAGVSSRKNDRLSASAYNREDREYRRLNRSGDNAIVREHYSEVGVLLPGAQCDVPILEAYLTMRRLERSEGSLR